MLERRLRRNGAALGLGPRAPTARVAVAISWTVAIAVWATLAPFAGPGGRNPLSWFGSLGVVDVSANLLLLLPLALVCGVVLRTGRSTWLVAVALSSALAAVLELGQIWIPGRHLQASDVLLNVIGWVLGVAAVRYILRLGVPSTTLGRWIVAGCVLAVLSVQVAGGIVAHNGLRQLRLDVAPQTAEPSDRTWVRAPEKRGGSACAGRGSEEKCDALPAAPEVERELIALAGRSGLVWLEAACRRIGEERRNEEMLATLPSRRPQWPGMILWRNEGQLGLRITTAAAGEGARPQFTLPLPPNGDAGYCSAMYDRGLLTLSWEVVDASHSATIRLGLLEGWLLWRSIKYVSPAVVRAARITAAIALGLGIGLLVALAAPAGRPSWVYAGGAGAIVTLLADSLLAPGMAVEGAVLVGMAAAAAAAIATRGAEPEDLPAVVLRPGR